MGVPRVFSGEAGTLGALGGALTFPGHAHPWALLHQLSPTEAEEMLR